MVITLMVAFSSLLAFVGSGSFAARVLRGRKFRWLGVIAGVTSYWLSMSGVASILGARAEPPSVGAIVIEWAISVIAGLTATGAVTMLLRKALPVAAP